MNLYNNIIEIKDKIIELNKTWFVYLIKYNNCRQKIKLYFLFHLLKKIFRIIITKITI